MRCLDPREKERFNTGKELIRIVLGGNDRDHFCAANDWSTLWAYTWPGIADIYGVRAIGDVWLDRDFVACRCCCSVTEARFTRQLLRRAQKLRSAALSSHLLQLLSSIPLTVAGRLQGPTAGPVRGQAALRGVRLR